MFPQNKVDLVKSLATNMAEQRIKLHVANAERQQWSVWKKRSASFDQPVVTNCTQIGLGLVKQRKTRNRCAHIFTKIYTTVTADRDQAWWVYLSPLVPSHSGCTHSILSRHLSKNGINQSLYQGLGRKSNCTDHYRFLYPDVSYYL